MATIRLIPSTYAFSNSTYLNISNTNNMYTNTDSDTYATINNTQTGTTSYYLYIRGFNFDDVPSNATVNSFTVKLKARQSGGTINTSYSPKLCNGTSRLTSTCDYISTSTQTLSFTAVAADWEEIKGYGQNFGIRINCRRASRNSAASFYIYGAEVEVDYTLPNPRTVTSTLNGNGTIDPEGVTNTYAGETYTITITPDDKSEEVTITNNGVDVTSQLVAHGFLNGYSLIATNVTTSGISSGSSYAEYAIGHSAEEPYSSTSNMYASGGSTGYAEYSFNFSAIPNNAVIESIVVRCCGHRESSTISSTYVSKCAIYNGSTLYSEEVDFPSTSNSIITLTPNSLPSRLELGNLKVRHTVGYYGGLVLGISFDINYSIGTGIDHYTYTYTVSDNAVIAVNIGAQEYLHLKVNNNWIKSKKIYKKINGVWTQVELSTLTDEVIYIYLGEMQGYDQLGEVTTNSSGVNITINDGALSTGTYTLKYEDNSRTPIENIDEITTFTI